MTHIITIFRLNTLHLCTSNHQWWLCLSFSPFITHSIIHSIHILSEVWKLLGLYMTIYISLKMSTPSFSIYLSFCIITLFSHLGSLFNGIYSKNFIISISFYFFFIVRGFYLISHHSYTSGAIKSRISNLSLEWEMFQIL